MNEPANRLQHQTTEIDMTLGANLVRTDLDQNSVTVGFRPWFEWDVDTRQVEVQTGVIHFIQPDNSIIGLRVDQSATMVKKATWRVKASSAEFAPRRLRPLTRPRRPGSG